MDLCVLVDDKLSYALTAEKTSHELCEQDTASRSMEVSIPLYSVFVRPHLRQSPYFGYPAHETN